MSEQIQIEPVGRVRRVDEDTCVLEVDPALNEALEGMQAGDSLQVLYWMHELTGSQRQMRKVHPRGDAQRPLKGVFALRSPMRPNPIGVSVVQVLEVRDTQVTVRGLDALDGSPIVDIKAAPGPSRAQRSIIPKEEVT